MIDTDKYEGHLASEGQTWAWSKWMLKNAETIEQHEATSALLNDAPLLLEAYKQLREDYEKMSEVLRQYGMDICRHCRVIYRDDDMNHPHYPSLHPWHMDGMCMKEMIE